MPIEPALPGFPHVFAVGQNDRDDDESDEKAETAEEADTEEEGDGAPAEQEDAHLEPDICLHDDLEKIAAARTETLRLAREDEESFDKERMTRGEGDRDLRAAMKNEATIDLQV